MYVVLTQAELKLYGDLNELGWDLELGSWPFTKFDAREVTLSEEQARRFGILAPRGEDWIEAALHYGYFEGKVPRVKTPEIRLRGYPSEVSKTTLGTPCELRTQAEAPECDDPLPF